MSSTRHGIARTETSRPSLLVSGLRKHYDAFAFGPVDLEVPRNSVTALIGQNGAGKTTLMKIVLGMTHADAGRIELFGKDVATLSKQDLAALRAEVGYVASECAYPLSMTVDQVARLHALAYPRFDAHAFDEHCARLELSGRTRRVGDLSRGMGMKLQLACALASQVRLLILDEPTAGLDPIVRVETLDVLRTWMEDEDKSILISSHITSDLEGIADQLVMLHDGKVALSCDLDTLSSMGVARLRASEVEQVLASGVYAPGTLRLLKRDLSTELLVPNRLAFERRWNDFVCDPASMDDVMTFVAKGEVR